MQDSLCSAPLLTACLCYRPPPPIRHHVALITAHLRFFEALGRAFPIPDVEFIIATFDVPTIRLDRVPSGQPPVPLLRFCKSDAHADILVPDIHFQVLWVGGASRPLLRSCSHLHPIRPHFPYTHTHTHSHMGISPSSSRNSTIACFQR